MDEYPVLITDLDDIRRILDAAIVYFTAQDVAKAQAQFSKIRPSPMTVEMERVKERVNGIMSDFLLMRYEDEYQGDPQLVLESDEEAEPEEEEPLSQAPLRTFVPKPLRGVPIYEEPHKEDYSRVE